MSLVDDFWGKVDIIWGTRGQIQTANQTMPMFTTIENLENYYKQLPPDVADDPTVKALFQQRQVELADIHAGLGNPLTPLVTGFLKQIQDATAKYELNDPKTAEKKAGELAADVLAISAGAAVVELALGALPNGEGTVASTKVSQIMAWLGMGAVVTAVAHDPIKMRLLRPWQDFLEAKYRNRRPGDIALFQAYKTRELSPAKISDLSKLEDTEMDKIEAENQKIYDREIAKWGYSEEFAGALARSATVTMNFTQLNALARQGLLSRGLAIYSLWGQGYDRVVMRPALDALMRQNEMASYEGFRSLVEPSYVEGVIPEADLLTYWDRIMVPKDVQGWVLPRLKKKREAYALKQAGSAAVKERDLTVSQIQSAYQNSLQDRAHSQNMILSLGYSLDEAKILLDLAELRRKLPGGATLKRLPLTDYEKAHKNGILKVSDVLARMQGEYAPADIELERKLLEIGEA